MSSSTAHTRESLVERDRADPLRGFRDEFALPPDVIYLDGNSLGPLPKAAPARTSAVVEQEWGGGLIRSWNSNGWYQAPVRIGAKIAQLVGGTRTGACVATDTTSINVFKAVAAALGIQRDHAPQRRVIVSERANFPTDLYMVEGIIATLDDDYELRLIDDEAGLHAALGEDVAVVLLTHVNYRSGRMWDMPAVTKRIHAAGALAVWDLCHSVGAVPLDLDGAAVDFAVGCTYKYLNGGPGSPAFVWVADRHLPRCAQPLSGWFGHRDPFRMAVSFAPADDIRRFLCGTQPLVSMLTMEVGVDLALRADGAAVRRKSLELTTLFMQLVQQRLAGHPLTLVTPVEEGERGSHVSYEHPQGYAVMQALIARGVIGDYREPDVLRFGITPLYLGYADIWDAVEALREVLDDEHWRAPQFARRGAVT